MENEMTEEEMLQAEEQQEQLHGGGFGQPSFFSKETIFRFFRELIYLKDSSKIANLDKEELGMLKNSVRGLQSTAAYAEAEGWENFGKFLRSDAEIVLATSLSRKGKLIDNFVTQIKKEQKIKPTIEKKGWFSQNKKEEATI